MKRLFNEHVVRDVKSLDGAWRFLTDPKDVGESEGWQNGLPTAACVTVPSVWNTDLKLLQYEGVAWYQREFYTEGGTLRFCFGGVMTEAKVYLDGALLGEHYGGFCEFEFISRDVQTGTHTLTVRVDNRFDKQSIPQKKVDWYHYGGITRSVTVERLQGICALYQRFDYTLSEDLKSATGRFTVELYNAEKRKRSTQLRICLGGREIFADEVSVSGGKVLTVVTPDFAVEDAHLWDMNDPYLYDVTVLTDTDDLFDRVGLRLVETKEGKIWLNGRVIELRGVNRHEDHPDWGMAFPEGLMKRDLDIIFDMGCNAIRGSHYPNSRPFLDMLDERGVLFWSEIPIWGCGFSPEALADPVVIERGLQMHREMVRYYCNHPSIIIWGMHNEIRSDLPESVEMTERYYDFLKKEGGNRLVSYASHLPLADINFTRCDVICINAYLGWYGKSMYDWPNYLNQLQTRLKELGVADKPMVMSEFGGAAIYGHHTFDAVKGTEEYQAKLLGYCLDLFHADPMIAGTYIWQFSDIRTCAEMGLDRARGFNNKGIVNEYRRPKLSYGVVKACYERFASEEK